MRAKACALFTRARPFLPLALLAVAVLLLSAACLPGIGQTADPPDRLTLEGAIVSAPATGPQAMKAHEDCAACHVQDNKIVRGKTLAVVPHLTEGWEQCSFCHSPNRLRPLPEKHPATTDDVCIACHKPTASPPPPQPHLAFAGKQCSDCHGTELALPPTHTDRPDFLCQLCHKPADKAPPEVPHTVADNAALCSSCHGDQAALAPPENHAGWDNQTCALCHQERPGGAPKVTHALDNRLDCTYCHSSAPPENRLQ
jgi:hypothetical protein